MKVDEDLPSYMKVLAQACACRQSCRKWEPEGVALETSRLVTSWIRDDKDIKGVHDALDMEGLWLKVELHAKERLSSVKDACEMLSKGKPDKQSWYDDIAAAEVPPEGGKIDFSVVVAAYRQAAEKHLLKPAFATEMKTRLNKLVKESAAYVTIYVGEDSLASGALRHFCCTLLAFRMLPLEMGKLRFQLFSTSLFADSSGSLLCANGFNGTPLRAEKAQKERKREKGREIHGSAALCLESECWIDGRATPLQKNPTCSSQSERPKSPPNNRRGIVICLTGCIGTWNLLRLVQGELLVQGDL
eukprot:1314088-Amphidinium_carterae.1